MNICIKYIKHEITDSSIFLPKDFPPNIYIKLMFVYDADANDIDDATANTCTDNDNMYIVIVLTELCLTVCVKNAQFNWRMSCGDFFCLDSETCHL